MQRNGQWEEAASEEFQEKQEAFDYYQTRLRENHVLDYDDLLLETLKLFEAGEEVNRKSFSYLLVDEFQDVSPLQFKLLLE